MNWQDYANGMHTAFGYDDRGFINQETVSRGGQTYSQRTLYRDTRDRITAFQKGTDNSANPMENGRGDRFRYDEEGQLVEAWYNAADPANSGNGATRYDNFNYDALGNRFGWDYVASRGQWMNFTRKDNGLNQYRAWWPYSIVNYDDDIGGSWGNPGAANGAIMQDGNITAGYNALNQPMLTTSAATGGNWMFFGYDPLGRCVKRWTGPLVNGWVPPADSNPATYFYYDGWGLIQEGPNASAISAAYILGNGLDEIVADFSMSNYQWLVHHSDARGHCTMLTDWGGNIMEQYEYDAFGLPYFFNSTGQPLNSSTYGNRFLFTGREYLSDLKLYDYRNRMYQPELGRFMQPDPKEFAAGDYNLYRYCHNDPVNKSDPTGLEFTDRDVELVEALPGMFGKTEFSLKAGVGVVENKGTFSLQVTKYDVTVTSKQVATTAEGKARTSEAVEASKEHEGLHTGDIKAVHDANQNKVLQTGYPTREAAAKDAQKEANKLNSEFGKAEAETNRHQPDEKWKDIMQRELPGK
jgi:RHS repeat-associated protein